MKKQLIIAAVAATMSAASFADISIKGDADFQYARINNDAAIDLGGTKFGQSTNATRQRVRLHVTGKSGDTTVKLGLRNDGGTRVSNGALTLGNARKSGSGAGNAGDNSSQFNVDYLYLTTKLGGLNIKAGDWWDTTGLGVARKGKADLDRVEFSAKLVGWKLGFETGAGSSSSVLSAIGKIGGFSVKVEHNTSVNVVKGGRTGTAAVAGSGTNTAVAADINGVINGFGAVDAGDYFDISVKGKIGSVGVAAEYFAGNNDSLKAIGIDDANAYVVHLWTKLADITWHIAYAQSQEGVAGITGSGNKFSPLGVSILAGAPGVNGAGAIGNFGNDNSEDTVYGVRADLKVSGMGVQVAAGNLELAGVIDSKGAVVDDTFWDIIVKRPLGKGSNIQFSIGDFNDVTSTAAKISVKF